MDINILKKITPIYNNFIFNEVPTKLNVTQFQTANAYVSGTLTVYLNGIKEKYIIEESTTVFSLPIDSIDDDYIEVDYIKS
jgi:hypothetical protein